MATKRKSLTKKTRFEVFKRDSFKCQYCGATAPEAVLVVDHIDPISQDGADEMINYITACQPCNAGKSDRKLSDTTAVLKQRAQLEELAIRREQLEMMLDWRNELKSLDEDALEAVKKEWSELTRSQYYLNETGQQKAKQLLAKFTLAKFTLAQILDAMKVSATQYLKFGADGVLDKDSVNEAWEKVKGIAHNSKEGIDRYVYYVRAIARNRFTYCNEGQALSLIKDLKKLGAPDELLKEIAVDATSWTDWKNGMYNAIAIAEMDTP